MPRTDNVSRILIGALAVFFSFLVLPRVAPVVDTTAGYFFCFLTVLLVVGILAALALASAIAVAVSRNGRHPRAFAAGVRGLRVTLSGLFLFGAARVVLFVTPQALPSSSYIEHFDRSRWTAPGAADYVRNDVTPRQKMLGDVVERILPGATREQIEAQLGPSLDTPYFRSNGRDLIYVLGPERGFFGLDSEWLLIWLESDGRFRRYELARN